MDGVTDDLSNLQLLCLPNNWVDRVFLSEFAAFDDIPEEYQNVLDNVEIKSVFEDLLESISEVDLNVITWADLSLEIPLRQLLAVIGYHIKLDLEGVFSSDHRDTALLAARVYFRFLLIPGSSGYNVYHSKLFAQSISCLGFPKLMCERGNKFSSNKQLTAEVNNLLQALEYYVIDLQEIILKLKLKPTDINFEDILSNLLDVAGGSITQNIANVGKYRCYLSFKNHTAKVWMFQCMDGWIVIGNLFSKNN